MKTPFYLCDTAAITGAMITTITSVHMLTGLFMNQVHCEVPTNMKFHYVREKSDLTLK